jgi:hypothetical protein
MQNLEHLKAGEEVLVFDVNGSGVGQPPDGWPGTVTKVGAENITVNYGRGRRPTQFKRRTGRAEDGMGQRYVLTADVYEQGKRWSDAERELRKHGVLINRRDRFTPEQMEKLAQLVRELPQEDQAAFQFLEGL